jgi:hypothetical protein
VNTRQHASKAKIFPASIGEANTTVGWAAIEKTSQSLMRTVAKAIEPEMTVSAVICSSITTLSHWSKKTDVKSLCTDGLFGLIIIPKQLTKRL